MYPVFQMRRTGTAGHPTGLRGPLEAHEIRIAMTMHLYVSENPGN
jgi:hypothetical protein